jgi:phosphopantothenoylcysteine decarboxylase/phosphopantothenate--cysteine ligase
LWLGNRSTAATGLALAREAFRQGADVELWLGAAQAEPPAGVEARSFAAVEDLLALAPRARGADAVLVPAAVGDYAAAGPRDAQGKVPLQPTPKFVDALREHFRGVLVAFKAESGLDDKALLARARALQERTRAALVVANDLERVGRAETEALLVEPERAAPFRGTREELAAEILRRVAALLAERDAPRQP